MDFCVRLENLKLIADMVGKQVWWLLCMLCVIVVVGEVLSL